jgi:hypothetical protein
MTMMIAGNIIGNVLGIIVKLITGYQTQNSTIELIAELNPIAILAIAVIIGPFFEELVFRKMLLDRLSGYNERIAILTSGILFGFFHTNFYQFFYAMGLGIIFAYVYTKTGKLWTTYIMHVGINLFSGFFPIIILQHIDLNDFTAKVNAMQNVATDQEATQALTEFMSNPYFLMYMAFIMLEFGLAVAGLVLLIVNIKKFFVPLTGPVIPKNKKLIVTLFTIGMIIYMVVTFILTIITAVQGATKV